METILRNLYGVIYRCKNDEDWTMDFINDGIYVLSGYEKEEILSQKVSFGHDIIHPDDQEWIWEMIQQHMQQRLPYEMEYRIVTKTGMEKWVLERGQGIYEDGNDGKLLYLEGFITDISKQKKTEEALKKAERDLSKYKAVIERSDDFIAFSNAESQLTYINPAGLKMLHLNIEDENLVWDIIDEETTNKREEYLEKLNKDGTLRMEFNLYSKDKEAFCEMDNMLVKVDDEEGRFVCYANIARNISELKRLQADLMQQNKTITEINHSKDRLFSLVAHDLKGPVGNLKNWLDLISTTSISKEQFSDLVTHFQQHIDKVLAMLEGLLEWARTQLSGFTHTPGQFDMLELAKEVVEIAQDAAEKKGISLDIEAKKETHEVFADRNQIQVVLRNIIANAIKFTDLNGKVEVRLERTDGQLKVSISDTGKGMTHSEMAKLFNIQSHFTKEGTRKETGTGLGLLLAKEMTTKNNGEIWVESEPEKGSVFHFTVPMPVETLSN